MADSSAPTTAAAHPFKIIVGATPFGAPLKDTLVAHLGEYPGNEVVDLGDGPCYVIAADVGRLVSSSGGTGARGLVVCGIGSSVCIFTNKFPGAFATACLSVDDAVNARSINNCNILAVSALCTPPDSAVEILDAWLDTPFKSACPASNGLPWSDDVLKLLDRAEMEMRKIRAPTSGLDDCASCAICCLVKGGVPNPFDMIPGGSVKIIREHPIAAIVSFKAGSVEPPHHHTFAHDQAVLKGKMSVWNLTKNRRYDLMAGDYLFMPARDVHMVKHHEDTKFLVKWYGHCDMFFHEHLEDY